MLEQICGHIHNYFDDAGGVSGAFVIEGGVLTPPPGFMDGEYYRVRGSRFNDGVHRHPADDLVDEAFTGELRPMRPPRGFLRLVAEIAAWQGRYGVAADSPYQSENVIGVYAYAKPNGRDETGGWRRAFADRLDEWRRVG